MEGWIKLHRRILDNPMWTKEPFTHGQAWVDLLLMANHKDQKVLLNGTWGVINRGQILTSTLKLAERWKWSRGRVNRFLDVLKMDGMLTIICNKGGTTNGTTLIIDNYDIYQDCSTTNDTTNDTTVDTTVDTTNGHKQEYKEYKEVKNNNITPLYSPKGEDEIPTENSTIPNIEHTPSVSKEKVAPKRKAAVLDIEPIIATLPEAVKDIVRRWVEYKKTQFRFTYKSEDSFKTWLKDLYNKSRGDVELMGQLVEEAIKHSWQGIYELKNINSNGNNPNNQISMQRINEAAKARREYERQLFGN